MRVLFDKTYLKDLYEKGDAGKKHHFQMSIIKRYIRIIDLMMELSDVSALTQYKSLHYEHLKGDKQHLSSVRVNDKYRIEFEEILVNEEIVASVCNIIEMSNHYN